jgi:hypothetical protein
MAFSFDDDRFAVLNDSVEHGRGERRIIGDGFGPLFVGAVGSDDR